MLQPQIKRIAELYDRFDNDRTRHRLEKLVVYFSALGFLLHLLLIFIASNYPPFREWLPGIGQNYFKAVYTPFSFILFYEVLMLVMALPRSHSSSVGKQYQIISLIVVRRVFKDLGEFRDLESWLAQTDALTTMLLDMTAALFMFLAVTLFYRFRKLAIKQRQPRDLQRFIDLKKLVASLLGFVLITLAIFNVLVWLQSTVMMSDSNSGPADLDAFFFPAFFEFMIFTDVLLLIVSIAFYDRYEYVFRNAGLVISTVLLRISLSTPQPYDLILALIAMIYGLAVILVFSLFTRFSVQGQSRNANGLESSAGE